MKHLYFIRHGLSEANIASAWGGQINTPLAPEGHEQAKKAGIEAAKQGLKFDIIISSPLDRAKHTAHHIAYAVGYPFKDIQVLDILTERAFGELEGTTNTEATDMYITHGEAGIDTYKGVEQYADLKGRTDLALAQLRARPEDVVLVVGHGAFARSLRRSIEGIPLDQHVDPYPNAKIFKLI